MLRRMSSRQLTEWMAYERLEPGGDELLDAHMAQLTAMVELTRRPKAKKLEAERFRFWKKVKTDEWDPQAFFDALKTAFQGLSPTDKQ